MPEQNEGPGPTICLFSEDDSVLGDSELTGESGKEYGTETPSPAPAAVPDEK